MFCRFWVRRRKPSSGRDHLLIRRVQSPCCLADQKRQRVDVRALSFCKLRYSRICCATGKSAASASSTSASTDSPVLPLVFLPAADRVFQTAASQLLGELRFTCVPDTRSISASADRGRVATSTTTWPAPRYRAQSHGLQSSQARRQRQLQCLQQQLGRRIERRPQKTTEQKRRPRFAP